MSKSFLFLLLSDGRLGIICWEFLEFCQVLLDLSAPSGDPCGGPHHTTYSTETYCIIELVALHNLYYRQMGGCRKEDWSVEVEAFVICAGMCC